jgi:Mg2+ and Co2+ transporter CorA
LIWVYEITESNELQAWDASSVQELQRLSDEGEWVWIDFMDPNSHEYEVLAGFLSDGEMLKAIKAQTISARPEKVDNYLLFSIPYAVLQDNLETFPLYVLIKEGLFLTVRTNPSSLIVKSARTTFEECVGQVCEGPTNSAFVLSRLFHEITNSNLDVIMSLRENIDRTEQRALEHPADKEIGHSVFGIKRSISALERVLWAQRELMLNVREGIVPTIHVSEEIKASLSHPINNISRELSLLDSHNGALDSILSLQDLGMIHRVERNLITLTIMALVVSILLILLEIDIINLLSR